MIVKTKNRVKASHLIDKLVQKIRNYEKDEIYGKRVEQLALTEKDIRLYFYCKDANRWWFESKQKISDIIESGKWPNK